MIMRTNLSEALLIGMTFFLVSGSGFAASTTDPIEELKGCARTEDKAVRIACYEALGERVLAEESVETAQVAEVEPDVVESELVEPDVVEPDVLNSQAAAPVVVEAAVSEPAAVEAAVVETAQPQSTRLPDDLGVEKKEEKKSAETKSYRGHVRSCGQMLDDRWYFVFEGGQVWKQSSNGTYRFRECDFDATITKDFFSYKMKIDGGKTLRVRRER